MTLTQHILTEAADMSGSKKEAPMADLLSFLSSADAVEFAATFLAGAIVGALAVLAFCRFVERREQRKKVKHPYLFQ